MLVYVCKVCVSEGHIYSVYYMYVCKVCVSEGHIYSLYYMYVCKVCVSEGHIYRVHVYVCACRGIGIVFWGSSRIVLGMNVRYIT